MNTNDLQQPQQPKVRKEFFTIKEAAQALGKHEATIRNWINKGLCPTIHVNSSKYHSKRIHLDTLLQIHNNTLRGLPPTYNLSNNNSL